MFAIGFGAGMIAVGLVVLIYLSIKLIKEWRS